MTKVKEAVKKLKTVEIFAPATENVSIAEVEIVKDNIRNPVRRLH